MLLIIIFQKCIEIHSYKTAKEESAVSYYSDWSQLLGVPSRKCKEITALNRDHAL